jgi:L,D-transpeptidase ErfK/SrfK
MTGAVTPYTVQPGDSLISMGARFGVEASTLAEDNDMPAGRALRPGQVLLVDSRHIVPAGLEDGILINVPQRMLFVARRNGVEGAFPVAVGRRDWPSPIGAFEVGAKEIDPTWDVPVSIQREMAQAGRAVLKTVLPGPDNPLGDRWLGLKDIGVGIHGTNQPTSVFRVTTHGCLRLHPDDARVLFELVEVGSPVRIVYEPVLLAVADGNHVWLEVHRDAYGRVADLSRIARDLLQEAGAGDAVDAGAFRRCVQERRGRPCRL